MLRKLYGRSLTSHAKSPLPQGVIIVHRQIVEWELDLLSSGEKMVNEPLNNVRLSIWGNA